MDSEKTIYDSNSSGEEKNETSSRIIYTSLKQDKPTDKPSNKNNKIKAVAAGGASAILLGSVSAMLMSAAKAEGDNITPDENNDESKASDYLVDNDLKVADGINDEMSFSQAFATARAEVGPGGVFEWRGNVYSTYIAEEWNAMSESEKHEYQDHFTWTHGETAHHHHEPVNNEQHDVGHTSDYVSEHETHADQPQNNSTEEVHVENVQHFDDVSEVEVLGVVHDEQNGMNMGFVEIDNQQVTLIDIDDDKNFDLMAFDENHDGEFQENEFADISHENITVDSLGGFTDGYLAQGDENIDDYTNDAIVEV